MSESRYVEVTLTDEQIAYAERLVAASTDTGKTPISVRDYVQGIVDRNLAPETSGDALSYG